MRSVALAVLLAALIYPHAGWAEAESVGRIKSVEGTAFVVRQDSRQAAQAGDLLYQGDILETGADSQLGLLLGDDTRLSVGAETTFEIKEYLYRPEANEGSLLTRLAKGTLLYVSGLIAKVSPESAEVETPVGTLGIRGTRFLVVVEEVRQ